MKKVFLDSSVLVAACASETGASSLILVYCQNKKIQGYISIDTVGEARKNVLNKLSEKGRERLIYLLKKANLNLVDDPLAEEIVECEKVIHEKDAPILAAAIKSPVKFLLTLDRKHFLQPKVKGFTKHLKILTPGEFVKEYFRK